jgi:hypothetical protein
MKNVFQVEDESFCGMNLHFQVEAMDLKRFEHKAELEVHSGMMKQVQKVVMKEIQSLILENHRESQNQ